MVLLGGRKVVLNFFFIYFWEEKLLLLFIRNPITFTLQYIIFYIYTRLANPNLQHLTQVF